MSTTTTTNDEETRSESESGKLLPAVDVTLTQEEVDEEVEDRVPTADEIAHITAKAVDDCERAANSLEDIAAAGDRLNRQLGTACREGAKMFRDRGKAQAALITNFAKYVEGQCEVVSNLHRQAEQVSPPPKHRPPTKPIPFAPPLRR